jgi:hypothetical protein
MDDDEPVDPEPGVRWVRMGQLFSGSSGSLHCASCFVVEGAIHHERCTLYPTNTTVPTGTQRPPAERA